MLYLENSGEGRRYRFHGAFASLAASEKKERATPGAFIRESRIGTAQRFLVMSPKNARRNPTTRRAKSASPVLAKGVRMARRSRRRKSAARRKSRRRSVGVALMNSPRRRRRHHARSARRNPARRHARRARSFRRNPPGIVGAITGALMDGALVTAGDVAQNLAVRYIPDILPATMSNAVLLNGLIKDLGGIVAGAYAVHKVLDRDKARFVVAGQSFAAIARVLRATNVPVVSTALGEYDPMRLGIYSRGVISPAPASRQIAPPKPNNVATLRGVGIYTDGMSSAPGLF